jgi:pimeloyl-ACP methyl ester carboxylesterase
MSFRTIGILALAMLGVLVALYAAAHFYGRSLIYHPSHAVVAPTVRGVAAERIRTEDGETLVAWWRPPQQGQPVFLFFDGNGGRPEIQDGRWRRIAEHGAGFLAVYYRGYSGSTGSPTEAGLRRDARAGYDWLIAHGFTPRDIVIHGFSLGSSVAVQLAAEHPARALILEAPMTGVDDIAAEHGAGLFAKVMRDSFRSRDYIARVHMPVLIVHGDADSVVPFAHGERLFALANEPKQFVRMPGSDHATLARDGLYDHIWSFLDQHPPE